MDAKVRIPFTDLDGTVRKGKDELGRFVNTPEDVELFEGVKDILWRYYDAGWLIVGIINQGGIALGHMTWEAHTACVIKMFKLLARDDGIHPYLSVEVCPHAPDAGCLCRKPRYGMLAFAAHRIMIAKDIDWEGSLFVGDRPEDRECAAAAGIRFQVASQWREKPLGLD